MPDIINHNLNVKAKISLYDGTEFDALVSIFDKNVFQIETTLDEMTKLFKILTIKNLREFTVAEEDGTASIYTNKKATGCNYADGVATFYLSEVDDLEARVINLEGAFDDLSMLVSDLLLVSDDLENIKGESVKGEEAL